MSVKVDFGKGPRSTDQNRWASNLEDLLFGVEELLGNVQAILDLSDCPPTPGRWLAAISYEIGRLHSVQHRDALLDGELEQPAAERVDDYDEALTTAAELARVAARLVGTYDVTPEQLTRRVEVYRVWPREDGGCGTWDVSSIEVPLVPGYEVTDEMIQTAVVGMRWDRPGVPEVIGLHSYDDSRAELF